MSRVRYLLSLFVLILLAFSPHISFAQTDPEEAYDPFADYSEFDEASDEEADINFFRNGRFLTVGLALGPQTFTAGMDKAYGDGPVMGLSLSYFFDLRLAMTLGLMSADHSAKIQTNQATYTGNVSFSEVNLHLKYYLSTQNMMKGIADLNPYIVGGFSQVTRSYSVVDTAIPDSSKESLTSTDLGLGIEIPIMRRKSFFGFQAVYHYVSFNDENRRFLENGELLLHKVDGDYLNWQFILGMNF